MLEVLVCIDCLETVEFDSDTLGVTPDEMFERQAKMKSHVRFNLDKDLSTERLTFVEDADEFSTSACETCGSHLAGSRYKYTF